MEESKEPTPVPTIVDPPENNNEPPLEKWEIDLKANGGLVQYSIFKDNMKIAENLHWFVVNDTSVLESDTLFSWRKTRGEKSVDKKAQNESSQFILPEIYTQLYTAKSSLKMSQEQLQDARERANVFEKVKRGGIFMNRAAMKMANLDAILGFEITNPNSGIPPTCAPLVAANEPLYFADICAGPGGFSEYFLWRKSWECKGFGFTLKGDHDFNLNNFVTGTENFEPHYGSAEDGNIKNPANVSSFIDFVLENTDRKGVHFVTADGGIAVTGQESLQEVLTKDIFLAQVLVAIALVRPGGHFICKSFDIFTPFSIGLVYLLHKCFKIFCIHKPNTSRPANSERYIICKYKNAHTETDSIHKYLLDCHKMLWKNACENGGVLGNDDIEELVPIQLLKEKSPAFFKYLSNSNNRLAIHQILGLQKLLAYYKDKYLFDSRQQAMRQDSISYWNIDYERPRFEKPRFPQDRFGEINGNCPMATLDKSVPELSSDLMSEMINSPYDWRVAVVSGDAKKRGFYFGFGAARNYLLTHMTWSEDQIRFQLSKDTLLFGEIVTETKPDTDKSNLAFHVIDAMYLGGQDIRALHFNERQNLCSKFTKAMNKTTRLDLIPIRTRQYIRLESIENFFAANLNKNAIVNGPNSDPNPTGMLFLKITADPWMMAFSKQANMKYWFNTTDNLSTFTLPPSAIADFTCTMENRIIWPWKSNYTSGVPPANQVSADNIITFVKGKVCAVATK